MNHVPVFLLTFVLAACGKDEPLPALTKELQESLTPQRILDALKAGNERFLRGEKLPRDNRQDQQDTAQGQYPAAAIVDCIDSRVAVDIVFELGLGDAFFVNVAGNIINPDVLGSLEYACKVAGSKVIVVLGHTSCGAVKGACDDVKLGNLTQLLEKIRPAIDAVPDDGSPRTSKNREFTTKVATANVRLMVQRIRDESPTLRELESRENILIVGAMYDVETGRVSWLEE